MDAHHAPMTPAQHQQHGAPHMPHNRGRHESMDAEFTQDELNALTRHDESELIS